MEGTLRQQLVVLTRATEANKELYRKLDAHSVSVKELPLIGTRTRPLTEAVCERLFQFAAGKCDWLVFSSANGVRAFASHLQELSLPASVPANVRVAAQGTATAAEFETLFGRQADLIPGLKTAQGLGIALAADGIEGKKIFLPLASATKGNLLKVLRASDADVFTYAAYETGSLTPDRLLVDQIIAERGRGLIFPLYSPSTVAAAIQVFQAAGDLLAVSTLIAVGPVTAEEILGRGLPLAAVARTPEVDDMLEVVLKYI